MKSYEIIGLFTYTLTRLVPKKKNRWVFGAWFGSAASDNSRALYDYVRANHPEIECVWVLKNPAAGAELGCRVVKRNSLESLKYIATARVAVMNQGYGDFNAANFLGGAYKVQLWHGIAWKKIFRDAMPRGSRLNDAVFDYINRFDLYTTSADGYTPIVKSAFGAEDAQIVRAGQPRNEKLFDEAFCRESRRALCEELGIDEGRKIVAYMPTFRDTVKDVFSFTKPEHRAQIERLAAEKNFVLVEKLHYQSIKALGIDCAARSGSVVSLPGIDAQRLLAAADVLITDYSSCFFDFIIRDLPVIHFAYDYDYYKDRDRGLYDTIENEAAGTVARDEAGLWSAIAANIDGDPERDRRQRARERFIQHESPENSRIICEKIWRDVKYPGKA